MNDSARKAKTWLVDGRTTADELARQDFFCPPIPIGNRVLGAFVQENIMRISVEGRRRDLAPISEYGQRVLSEGICFANRVAGNLWAFHLGTETIASVTFLLEGSDFRFA